MAVWGPTKAWPALVAVLIAGVLSIPNAGLLAAPSNLPTGPLVPARIPSEPQWSIEAIESNPTEGVIAGQTFALRNNLAGKFLTSDGQTPTWQDSMDRSFFWFSVLLAFGSPEKLPYARLQYLVGPVALVRQPGRAERAPRFLKAASAGGAVPVIFSDARPLGDQWEVRGGSRFQLVPLSQSVILHNVVRGDDLVFCSGLSGGANLSWQRECGSHPRGPQR